MSVEVLSLGCRLNLSESEELRGLLAGAEDLVVVNSCAVTAEAVRQTRQAIRRARRTHPDARLLVTGCAAEVEREMLSAMPEVDGLVANAAKLDVRRYAAALSNHRHPELVSGSIAPPQTSVREEKWTLKQVQGDDVLGLRVHTRAFIAVQNGCDHACTFCVIPQGRGPSRSLAVTEVLREVERHLGAGSREVVLTGVDLTSWGYDLPGAPSLGALVEAILRAFPALERLRLSSLDGIEIDPQLFELLAGEPSLLPYLHLSLQHGHDLILKRMKRRHLRGDAVSLVERLRELRPDLTIGADLIAGFPTEDEAAHRANMSIVAELGIVHGHIFPYSPRPGTPAARMPQLDAATIKTRAAELRTEVARVRAEWLGSLLGRRLRVLAERDGTGHAENFARVQLPPGTEPGSVVTVTPTRIIEGLLA